MKLWNVATRRELASIEAENVHYVTFSPDGQTLAAFGWDGSLRLWRAPVADKKHPHRGTIDAARAGATDGRPVW